MNRQSTERRLKRAIQSVTELKSYLERATRKLHEESDNESGDNPVDSAAMKSWLIQQVNHWRARRDAEPRDSDAFRFFHGKSEGFEAVVRFLEEQYGDGGRLKIDRGYLSAHQTSDTATMNLHDTSVEQTMPDSPMNKV